MGPMMNLTFEPLISSAQRTVACELVLLGMRLAATDIRYSLEFKICKLGNNYFRCYMHVVAGG